MEPTDLPAGGYAERLLRDLAALGVAGDDLLDRAVDVAADELELNEPQAVERVRTVLGAELRSRHPVRPAVLPACARWSRQ